MKQLHSAKFNGTIGLDDVIDLDPLASHLESGFGDPYELTQWIPELGEAVRHYLVHEIEDEVYAAMLGYLSLLPDEVSIASREAQADFIVAHNTPLDVIAAVHWAVVRTCGKDFEMFVRSLSAQRGPFDYEDIALWLEHQATYDERAALVRELDPNRPSGRPGGTNGGFDIETWLYERRPGPEALATAWQTVTGQSSTPARLTESNPDVIRAWAKEHGYPVGNRGRLPKKVLAEYRKFRSH
jgi:hypothetical protein